jgi:predicted dithiol-disulfide oxidoreductase (DUF899 family)
MMELEVLTTPEQELYNLSEELMKLRAKAAELRRKIPAAEVQDYTFTGMNGEKITLSEIIGTHDELILIHNMGRSCRYCTLWADGFNGFTKHFESRAAFAVTSPDPYEIARKFSMERGWMFRLFSTEGTTFKSDMGFADANGEAQPGVSIFKKEADGRIVHVTKDYFGPGDDYCSIWNFFDLLPSGKEWEPQYHYISTVHKH